MIVNLILNTAVLVLGAVFSIFPTIDKLPQIPFLNFDIDGALVTGVSSLHTLMGTFWVLQDVMWGLLALLAYYLMKMVMRLLLGKRSPVN